MADPTLTLGNYSFDPVPTVSIDKQWIRTESGYPINITKTATFTGTLMDIDNNSSPILLQKQMDDDLCNCNECVRMLLQCGDDSVIDTYVRVQSITWGESPDNWTITIPITLIVEWDEAQDEHLPSGNPNPCLSCMRNITDTWSFQYTQPNSYYLSDSCPSGVQFLEFVHNVEAQAVNCCSGEVPLESGYVIAQNWVEGRLGFDRSSFNAIPGFGFDTQESQFGICEHNRSATLNKLGGSYAVQETFTISSPAIDCCRDDWSVTCEENNQSRLKTYQIQGTITGFETRDPANFHTVTTTKIENAQACWTNIQGTLHTRVDCYCPSGDGECPVNPVALSTSVGYSPTAGTVNYNSTYNNRPLALIENALSEVIAINDVNAQETPIEIPIPGRVQGPILRSCFTQPSKRKNVAIQVVFPYVCATDNDACDRLTNMELTQDQRSKITAFLCCIENNLINNNNFVLRVEDRENMSLPEGQYSRDVSWLYQSCNDELPSGFCP